MHARFKRRAAGLEKPGASAFTAGSHSHPDMRRWMPPAGSPDTDFLPEQGTIRSRARDIDRNHGVAAGAAQTNVDNIIGTGLRLKSRPDWKALGWSEEQGEAWSNEVESKWAAYANSTWFDAGRTLNFDSATRLVFRGVFTNGDSVALPLWLPAPGAPAATRFQVLESDRLANPNGTPDREGLRGGKEMDAFGAPVAYHILKCHPGDRFAYGVDYSDQTVRIPAFTDWGRARVLHVFDQTRPALSRGIPALTSVLRQFHVLGHYSNAELKAAVVNAMIALITESSIGQEGLVELLSNDSAALARYQEGLSRRGRASIDFNSGGMVLPLQLGEKAYGFTPARPNQAFEPFVLALFRQIAAGLNIPYELLLKDFSQTNYSSARAALLEAWRFFKGRRQFMAAYWAQPVFELWFEEQAATGAINAPDFYAKRAFYCRSKWIGDGRGWIDPLKEAQAAEVRLRNGLTTLEDECAEQGGDWEEVLEQRSREEKRAKQLNLSLPWMAGAKPSPDTVIPTAAEQERAAAEEERKSQPQPENA